MKTFFAIALLAVSTSACSYGTASSGSRDSGSSSLTKEDKHRLYAAALAASESPLDTDVFKDVCKKIGIFDRDGQPNDSYMEFVTEHFDWGTREDGEKFRREINTREKAKQYVEKHLR